MTTAADIIADAHLFVGIGDAWNPLDANTASLALRVLNNLIDSWSTEELTIFDIVEGTFNLNSGVAVYQVGPAQNLGLRPTQLERVRIVDAQNVTHPVKMIGVDEWTDIIYKPAAGRPEKLYNDNNFPIANWNFWPTPSFSNDIVHAWYWANLVQFSTLAGVLSAPPGYEWFYKTSLGIAIAPFHKITPDANMNSIANAAYANARQLNRQPKRMTVESPTKDRRTYNIYSDT